MNLGLDSKEAKLYIALVELGETSVLSLSRKSGVNRASIYYILEKMKKRGLVTHLKKGGTDTYSPVSPDLLLVRHKSHVKDLQASIPEFRGLANKTGQRPSVRFFEGIEGIKAMYADSLTSRTEILNYANSQEIRDLWPEYDHEYVAQRAANRIHLRGICPDDDYGRKVRAEDRRYFRQIRLLDPKILNFRNEINLYDHKIAMASFKDKLFGVIIESRALAETQRSVFEIVWKFASR